MQFQLLTVLAIALSVSGLAVPRSPLGDAAPAVREIGGGFEFEGNPFAKGSKGQGQDTSATATGTNGNSASGSVSGE